MKSRNAFLLYVAWLSVSCFLFGTFVLEGQFRIMYFKIIAVFAFTFSPVILFMLLDEIRYEKKMDRIKQESRV